MLNNIILPCQELYSEFLPTPEAPDSLSPKQIYDLANFVYVEPPPSGYDLQLWRMSERDKVWDSHRTQTMYVEQIYNAENEFEKYAQRMFECSGWLKFGFNETNGLVLKKRIFAVSVIVPCVSGEKVCYGRLSCINHTQRLERNTPNTDLYF